MEERREYKQREMSPCLGSGQEKRFYDAYKQRMHRSGTGLVNMKERTEGFM